MKGGQKTVAASGTAEQLLSTETQGIDIIIQAYVANTGIIYVGGSDVLASSKTGIALTPGDKTVSTADDLARIWIDATVNGEGVSFTYR